MKSRHLNMIAIGGSIGAGFFVGSGGALATGGPASIFLCFLIAGIMVSLVRSKTTFRMDRREHGRTLCLH